ncbi:MAG: hypothetical protein R6U98_27750, partial [Pirellulaceae bacterium]
AGPGCRRWRTQYPWTVGSHGARRIRQRVVPAACGSCGKVQEVGNGVVTRSHEACGASIAWRYVADRWTSAAAVDGQGAFDAARGNLVRVYAVSMDRKSKIPQNVIHG